jgi:Protein of unknown function TPD sequence-motif
VFSIGLLSFASFLYFCRFTDFSLFDSTFNKGIPFETEAQLRDRGTSRTPDVLLSCPVGIQVTSRDGESTVWKMICWIDSKVRVAVQINKT